MNAKIIAINAENSMFGVMRGLKKEFRREETDRF